MRSATYKRDAAVAYAGKWALGRNPAFLDFERLGGDCTNFVSQCLMAGGAPMNYTPVTGWYYIDGNRKAAAWTGVAYLYQFLMGNQGIGPAGVKASWKDMEPGDVVQLGRENGTFYHSLLVVDTTPEEIYVAAHTIDAWRKPLSSYQAYETRYLHITGVRL